MVRHLLKEPKTVTLKPMYFQLPGALFRGPLVYLASDLNTNVLSPRDGLIQLPTLQSALYGFGKGDGKTCRDGYLLMHLRLGMVQWATFMVLLNTHSVRLDVPALRLKPELHVYRSLELKL